METIYLVMQRQYQEEDYGLLSSAPHNIIKAFTSENQANDYIKTLPKPSTFYASRGEGVEDYYVKPVELVVDNLLKQE